MEKSFRSKFGGKPLLRCMVLTASAEKPTSPNLNFIFHDQMLGQAVESLGRKSKNTGSR
ncbi:MAG: hypothetical protein WC384_22065 [Prolixibacteraceae bacterium]|jgi:hypothetical protein